MLTFHPSNGTNSNKTIVNYFILHPLSIVCIRVSTPLQNTAPSFLTNLLLTLQTVQVPTFLGNLPNILVFREPHNNKIFHP